MHGKMTEVNGRGDPLHKHPAKKKLVLTSPANFDLQVIIGHLQTKSHFVFVFCFLFFFLMEN
jgi:hypothetical protein